MKLLRQRVLLTTAMAALAAVAASTAAGQQPQPPPADREAMNRELRERSRALDTLEKTVHPPPERPAPRLDPAQFAKDFRLLQVTASELLEATSGVGALDLKLVAKSAAEIRKRATRLGSGLGLPKPEKEGQRPQPEPIADDEGLRRSVAALGELIYLFARNPVFTQAGVVDAELSLKARRDLDEIIELSGRVKAGSEGLRKAARRPR